MNGKITRRSVLRGMGAACLAASAAPHVIPSGVLAWAGKAGANDRIVLGGVGVRRMGAVLMQGFARLPGVRVAAVADVDLRIAQAIATPHREFAVLLGGHPGMTAGEPADLTSVDHYQDYRRILDRDDIDAVVLGTPEHWHSLPSIHAAQAGKDVYCEKPLAQTIREGQLMVQAVRKYDCVFQTGTQRRSYPVWFTACRAVRNGRIGKVQRVIAGSYGSPWQPSMPQAQDIPPELDWDAWCGHVEPWPFHPSIQGNGTAGSTAYRAYQDFAGGTFTCTGSHLLDLVQWALGADDGGPIEVWTEGQPFDSRTRREPQVFMRYPEDVIIEYTRSPMPRFVGEKGSLTVDGRRLVSDPPELAEALEQEMKEDPEVQPYHDADHGQDWLQCIRDRRRPRADVQIGHRSTSVGHLGNIARWVSEKTGETGQRLQWDPQQERFTNSELGNQFLDRPRRKPYQLPEQV